MSKLLQFKEWLTIPETAEYLSKELGEAVKESDIYQFAMQGKIILSVILPEWGAYARISKIASPEEQIIFHKEHEKLYEKYQLFLGDFIKDEKLHQSKLEACLALINNKTFAQYVISASKIMAHKANYLQDPKITSIYGVWDIALIGYSDILFKRLYYKSINELYEEPFLEGGITLQSLDKNNLAELYDRLTKEDLYVNQDTKEINIEGLPISVKEEQEKEKRKKHYEFKNEVELEMPSAELPSGIVIITRIENLNAFIDSLNQTVKKNVPNTREKNNILKILSLLLNNGHELNNLPLDQPYKVADILIQYAELHNYEIPAKETIVKIIKESSEFNPN